MRVIIAGSRDIVLGRSDELVAAAMRVWLPRFGRPTAVLHGAARGIDSAADRWGRAEGIPIEVFPALWVLEGRRRAGPRRNQRMLEADAQGCVVIVEDAMTPGSGDMLSRARAKIPTMLYRAALDSYRAYNFSFEAP